MLFRSQQSPKPECSYSSTKDTAVAYPTPHEVSPEMGESLRRSSFLEGDSIPAGKYETPSVLQLQSTISHAIGEQTRMLSFCLHVLTANPQETGNIEAADLLSKACTSATLLDEMIRALNPYLRLIVSPVKKVRPVSTDDAIHHVVTRLAVEIDACKATISWKNLPTVDMDDRHARVLFENLIANALKFRRTGQVLIHVAARRTAAAWVDRKSVV